MPGMPAIISQAWGAEVPGLMRKVWKCSSATGAQSGGSMRFSVPLQGSDRSDRCTLSTPLPFMSSSLPLFRLVAATEEAPKFLAIAAAARPTDVVPPRIKSVSPCCTRCQGTVTAKKLACRSKHVSRRRAHAASANALLLSA